MDLVNYMEVIDKNTLAIGCLGALLAAVSVVSLSTVSSLSKLENNHAKEKNQIIEISKSLEEIKKEVELIDKMINEKNKIVDTETKCINCEKEAEINESDHDSDSDADDAENSDSDKSDAESDTESTKYNYKLPTELEKILHYIKYADDKTIETIVETCAGNRSIIIPNWYVKKDLESLTASKISQKKWEALYDNIDDLIDSTNALVNQWHDDFEENHLMLDSEEESDGEDKNGAILEESDDESEINSDILKNEDLESDSDIDIEAELYNKLMKLKYNQLKQLAGTNNNSLSKANLATKIVSSNKVSELEQKLKKFL